MNYYNEFDPKAAAWLRELMAAGLIPEGQIDERSITDVRASDLDCYDQCHFFAGIGGWSLALQLAGWPADRPVWTGSCPCQPFSAAGKQLGTSDDRHLWPAWFRLIRECRPVVVIGEQVEGAVGHGWLDGVSTDMEGESYAIGAAVLGAHSVGAPHIRQRLYWVADANNAGPQGRGRDKLRECATERVAWEGCDTGRVADASGERINRTNRDTQPERRECVSGMGREIGPWSDSDFDIVHCLDRKSRRVERGTFPLAHGVPGRVGLLRGYGNAIVPQVAAQFIKAFMSV